jgi:hypothetical protein
MKNDLFPTLRKELENSFGRKVLSSRDCLQMVDDIYQKTGYTVNANTLRRFFGLVKSNYSASHSTLSILLKYCGFNSPDEFENISLGIKTETIINKEEVLHFLISLFKNLPVEENNTAVIDPLVQQTVLFLERNPDLIDRFQREIAAIPAGQYYYFERSVNMDRLNDYYGEGLRFYSRSKNTNEAIVFVNSVQILRYWLTNNNEMLEKAMVSMSAINVNNSYPPHIMARYLAARLYYANIKSEALDRVLADTSRFYNAVVSKSNNSHPDFELILAEALILTKHYAEGSEFIKKGKIRLSATKKYESENQFSIWEKIVNTKRNTRIKAIITTPKPNIAPVSFPSPLTKKYYTLLYLMTNSRTKKANYAELISETGFVRLS